MNIVKKKWIEALTSRRFGIAVAGVVAVLLEQALGLTPEQVAGVTGIVMIWIYGDSKRKTE